MPSRGERAVYDRRLAQFFYDTELSLRSCQESTRNSIAVVVAAR
jgi:hypothetical protein